MSLLSLTELIN